MKKDPISEVNIVVSINSADLEDLGLSLGPHASQANDNQVKVTLDNIIEDLEQGTSFPSNCEAYKNDSSILEGVGKE